MGSSPDRAGMGLGVDRAGRHPATASTRNAIKAFTRRPRTVATAGIASGEALVLPQKTIVQGPLIQRPQHVLNDVRGNGIGPWREPVHQQDQGMPDRRHRVSENILLELHPSPAKHMYGHLEMLGIDNGNCTESTDDQSCIEPLDHSRQNRAWSLWEFEVKLDCIICNVSLPGVDGDAAK